MNETPDRLYLGFDVGPADLNFSLPTPEAPKNYKDKAKIDEYIAKESAERSLKVPLTPVVGKLTEIVVLGYGSEPVTAISSRDLVLWLENRYPGLLFPANGVPYVKPVLYGFEIYDRLRTALFECLRLPDMAGLSVTNFRGLIDASINPYTQLLDADERKIVTTETLCRYFGIPFDVASLGRTLYRAELCEALATAMRI